MLSISHAVMPLLLITGKNHEVMPNSSAKFVQYYLTKKKVCSLFNVIVHLVFLLGTLRGLVVREAAGGRR